VNGANWLISCLAERPDYESSEFEGLKCCYSYDSGLASCFLQLPGLPSALKSVDGERDLIKSSITEQLMRNFAIDLADIVIVVVYHVTFAEQEMIQQLARISMKNDKTVIVVHNFFDTRSRDEVNIKISKQILSNFDVEKVVLPKILGSKISKDVDPALFVSKANRHVRHVVMIQNESEFAKLYSLATLEVIKTALTQPHDYSKRTQVTIENTFVEYLNRGLPNILDNNDEFSVISDLDEQIAKSAEVTKLDQKVLNSYGFINLQPLTPAIVPEFKAAVCETQRYYNFLSFSKSSSEVPYQFHENDNGIILKVDVPGFCQEDLEKSLYVRVKEEANGFFFQIEAEKIDPCENSITVNKKNNPTRKISQCTTIIPMTKYSVKYEKQIENGILTVKMPKPKLISF